MCVRFPFCQGRWPAQMAVQFPEIGTAILARHGA